MPTTWNAKDSGTTSTRGVAAPSAEPRLGTYDVIRKIWQPFAFWVVILLIVSYKTFYPGLLNADSIDQMSQGLSHQYRDMHSPFMSGFWSLLQRIYTGPALMLLFDQAVFYVAAFIFASTVFRKSWIRYVWITLLVFYPPVFNILGMVTKDGCFVPLVFLGYALALKSLSVEAAASRLLNLLAQALLFISIAVRFEGAMSAAPVFFLLDFVALRSRMEHLRNSLFAVTALSIGAAIATVIVSLMATAVFNHQVIDARRTFPYQPTFIFDLVALSVANNHDYIPAGYNRGGLTIEDLERRFDPATPAGLIFDASGRGLGLPFDPASANQLKQVWRTEVREHWGQYLEHRGTFALYLLGIKHTGLARAQFYSDQRGWGYFNDLSDVNAGFRPNRVSRFYEHLSEVVFNWPIYLGWFYCLILLACLCVHTGVLLAEEVLSPMATIGAALAAGGLLQTALLFVVAPSALFRYLEWPMLASILSLTLAMCLIAEGRRVRFRKIAGKATSKSLSNSIA